MRTHATQWGLVILIIRSFVRDYSVIGTTLSIRKMELQFRAFVNLKKFEVMLHEVALGIDTNNCGDDVDCFQEAIKKLGWERNDDDDLVNGSSGDKISMYDAGAHDTGEDWVWFDNCKIMQYIGLKDKNEKKFFIGDIAQFDNGDKFQLKMEDHLEVFVDWIGDPEIEDQARDLSRIENATIIGNIYENPELL